MSVDVWSTEFKTDSHCGLTHLILTGIVLVPY